MSTTARRKRDPVKETRTNLLLQVVFFLPFLALFGFSVGNVILGTVFIVSGIARVFFPFNETLRTGELWLAVILTVVWIVTVYV